MKDTVGCVKRTNPVFVLRSSCPMVRFTHPTSVRFTHPMILLLVACLVGLCGPSTATAQVPNPEFDQGGDAPAGWTLSGGQGRWVDRQVLEVTGTGAANNSNYWRCDGYPFEPGRLYHFEMRARGSIAGGCVVSGPSFANRDHHSTPNDWKWYGHVFRAPESTAGAYLRLGQWQVKGTVEFDAVRVTPTLPVHRKVGDLILGEGETIRDGLYRFLGTFGHQGSNYHRTLQRATAAFNSDRWCLGPGSDVVYRFELPGHQFLSGDVSFNVNYHTRGGCTAEASRDGKQWHALATQEGLGVGEATLPADLVPAEVLFLRLRPSAENSSFQVNRVEFEAKLDGEPSDAAGSTDFADVEGTGPNLAIEQITFGEAQGAGQASLLVTVKNNAERPIAATLRATLASPDKSPVEFPAQEGELAGNGRTMFKIGVAAQGPGEHQVALALESADGPSARTTLTLSVPDFYRSDYGELLAGGTGGDGAKDGPAVWWCDAVHKVPRQRPPAAKVGSAARLSAARNDFEAVQIVVRPSKPLAGLRAKAGALAGPHDSRIRPENVQILRVYYHFVDHPTDRTGVRDWWPDALPPLDAPVDVEAGANQPLWVLVHVPDDAAAGDYSGEIRLEAEGWSATVPIELHVWDFALPKRNHIDTAFGLSPGNVFRYHQLKTDEDRRRVVDMYLKMFSEHRMSPYDLTPLDPIGVRFLPKADPPRAELDFTRFDRAMARAIDEFHFTSFRLPIRGMGGGTFHARHEPEIEGFGEATPEYQAMFSSYVKQLEAHFREKGWLEMPYIYWFDEPAPKDYEFVRNGFERLKKYAPGLRTMLTEQPEEALAGPVDIWCPVSPNYDHEAAEKRRAEGDVFWWYVCCGPKAPYCTLFIDHPATELRVWLWQTWQRRIVGNLVWQATYWTSSAAYPDEPQNPYEDPMGYVSGYSTPKGVKRFWGNGDGRFVYPPLSAAAPGISGPDPVIEPPVSSIRWEMLREGIEDYECLYLLRELVTKNRDKLSPEDVKKYEALLEVPESITEDMTTFTTDPAPIYARRAQVAEAIERLSK